MVDDIGERGERVRLGSVKVPLVEFLTQQNIITGWYGTVFVYFFVVVFALFIDIDYISLHCRFTLTLSPDVEVAIAGSDQPTRPTPEIEMKISVSYAIGKYILSLY